MRPVNRSKTAPRTQFLRHIDDEIDKIQREARVLRGQLGAHVESLVALRAEVRHARDLVDNRNEEIAALEAQLEQANMELESRGNPTRRRIPRLVMTRQWLCAAGEGGEGHHAHACRDGRIALKRLHRAGFGTGDSTLDEPRIPITPKVLAYSTNTLNHSPLSWIRQGLEHEGIGSGFAQSYHGKYGNEVFDSAYLALLHINNTHTNELALQDGYIWVTRTPQEIAALEAQDQPEQPAQPARPELVPEPVAEAPVEEDRAANF
jgi:hypothetical protein